MHAALGHAVDAVEEVDLDEVLGVPMATGGDQADVDALDVLRIGADLRLVGAAVEDAAVDGPSMTSSVRDRTRPRRMSPVTSTRSTQPSTLTSSRPGVTSPISIAPGQADPRGRTDVGASPLASSSPSVSLIDRLRPASMPAAFERRRRRREQGEASTARRVGGEAGGAVERHPDPGGDDVAEVDDVGAVDLHLAAGGDGAGAAARGGAVRWASGRRSPDRSSTPASHGSARCAASRVGTIQIESSLDAR